MRGKKKRQFDWWVHGGGADKYSGLCMQVFKYISGKSLGNLHCLSNKHMGGFLVNTRQNLVFIAIIKVTTIGLAAVTSLSGCSLFAFSSFCLILKAFGMLFSFLAHFGKQTKELMCEWYGVNGECAYIIIYVYIH